MQKATVAENTDNKKDKKKKNVDSRARCDSYVNCEFQPSAVYTRISSRA
jgi:hypothetical protein